MTVELTIFTKRSGALSKRIFLARNGNVASDASTCSMAAGNARRQQLRNLADLATVIRKLKPNQALGLGTPRDGLPDAIEIVTLSRVNGNPQVDTVARTGENFIYRAGAPALALLDIDTKFMPEAVATRVEELGGFWRSLVSALPPMKSCGRLVRQSTSAGLYRVDTGEKFQGSGGQHIYITAADGADIPRFLSTLHDRLWLAGLGWMIVSKSGALLERSIVDKAVGSPERLVFEGAPIVEPPLAQEPRKPAVYPGGLLDTAAACPPLSAAENAQLQELKKQERTRLAPEVAERRATFVEEQADRLVARGLSSETARRIIELQCDGVLLPEIVLPFDDPQHAGKSVADVFANPQRFAGATLADPIEGAAYGRGKAKILLRKDGTPFIKSFAHGGVAYELRNPAMEGKELERAIAEINRRHALVLAGNHAAIMTEQIEEMDGRRVIKLLPRSTFTTWMANRTIRIAGDDLPLASVWLTSRQRRQYEGLTFDPTGKAPASLYNLWRGFSVEPRPGDCSTFLAHLRDNVCNGDHVLFAWVEAWFADIVQHPAERKGTSLACRGKQGVGKTIIGKIVGSLFRDHYVRVDDPRYVVGRFNSHMVQALMVQADEAFWAGDKAAEGRLKGLVTDDYQLVEYKGLEAISVKNHLRLLITSNQEWIVPAGQSERRFAVLDVGEAHMQDHAYFAAIEAEMENGGREGLLHHFLTLDISGVDLRKIPNTTALREQQVASLSPEAAWWLDLLQRGRLPASRLDEPEANLCPIKIIVDDYMGHAQRSGARRRSSETQLGMFLTKMVGTGLTRIKRRYRYTEPGSREERSERGMVYRFLPLRRCRERFESEMKQKFDWEGPDEWQEDDAELVNRVRSSGFSFEE